MAWGDGLPREECAGRQGTATQNEHDEQAEQRYWQAADPIPGPLGARESRHLKVSQGQEKRFGEHDILEFSCVIPDPSFAINII